MTEELTMLRGRYCPYHDDLIGPPDWLYQEWLQRLSPTTLLDITKGRLSFDKIPQDTGLAGQCPRVQREGNNG
jgi:hypothetical protein